MQRSGKPVPGSPDRWLWLLPLIGASIVLALVLITPNAANTHLGTTAISTVEATLWSPTTSTSPQSNAIYADQERYMLDLINQDRQNLGLSPVAWDELAARVGRNHAQEMVNVGYFSHWDLHGLGPDLRYAIAGGQEVVMENAYAYYQRYSNGTPVPVDNWKKLVEDAEKSLMQSPGHRANILFPGHTHVGVGIAYNPETGELRIAQEFLNRYLQIDQSFSVTDHIDNPIKLSGRLIAGASHPILNLAYEPVPVNLSVKDLEKTSTFTSSAQFLDAFPISEGPENTFSGQVKLPLPIQPGYYHIRIFVTVNEEVIHCGEIIILRQSSN
jgi:uncharacterized protein YkwD